VNILVLCTGNSARSILLESILNRDSGGRIKAFSAGSRPAGRVHPQTLALLSAKGYPTAGLASKSWDLFADSGAPVMDAVITVCGSAAAETCPYWPGAPVRAHWGIDDPAAAPPARQEAAFLAAFARLNGFARALLALDFAGMDQQDLQTALNRAGA
jgi:protein-tyrosine-phosphatase